MAKVSGSTENVALQLLQRLVVDHGDAFRFSVSKKGRVWVTLTHWDNEKYNTSAEIGGFNVEQEFYSALAVICVGHYAKCFGGAGHNDTWLGVSSVHDVAADALSMCASYLGRLDDQASSPDKTPTENSQERDNETSEA